MASKYRQRPKSAVVSSRAKSYKDRYGAANPYKAEMERLSNNLHKASEIPIESREYLDPFSRGISQHLAHADAMLGPKRPQSAARDSSKQKGHVLATTHVSKKTKPKDQHNMSDELNEEDEAILNIRVALVKAKAVQTAQKMSESCKETTTDIKLKSKVSGGVNDPVICGAVSTCEGVPTHDKNYFRPRPPPKTLASAQRSPMPSPRQEQVAFASSSPRVTSLGDAVANAALASPRQLREVHPELQRRSLFVCNVRDSVATAQSRVKSGPRRRKVKDKPAGASSSGQGIRRIKSAEKVKHDMPTPQVRALVKKESSHQEPAAANEEVTLFGLHSVVEARYRGREQWWTGKIVLCRPDGTYDVQYGDLMERRVPAHLIRVKEIIDLSRMKKKMLLTGFVSKAAQEGLLLSGSFKRSDEERQANRHGEAEDAGGTGHRRTSAILQAMPTEDEDDVDDDATDLYRGNVAPNREHKTMVRDTVMQLAAKNHRAPLVLPCKEGDTSATGCAGEPSSTTAPATAEVEMLPVNPVDRSSGPPSLAGLMSGRAGLKKVQLQQEEEEDAKAKRETAEVARREQEKSEQRRLWLELQMIVAKEKRELAFEVINVQGEIGRGKFASVYAAEMQTQLHTKVFSARESAKRTFERLGNNLNKSASASSIVLTTALKVFEYKNAYPIVGGDWANDKGPEEDYLDDTIYTDGENGDRNQPSVRCGTKGGGGAVEQHYQDRYAPQPPSACLLEALREVRALAMLQHPNLVQLHGVVMKPRLIIVMEKMQCSLADALATPPEQLQVALTSAQRVHIMTGVSYGLTFMHDRKFIHRDIKAHNVLLTAGMGGFVAKLADFGTAMRMPSVQKLSESVGTSGYTAPEVIEGAYGLPADIFSFGILQWEALQPYGQRLENPLCGKDPEDTVYELSQGVRPPLDHCLVPAIHNMVEACWDTEPENRPSAADVAAAYEKLVVSAAGEAQ